MHITRIFVAREILGDSADTRLVRPWGKSSEGSPGRESYESGAGKFKSPKVGVSSEDCLNVLGPLSMTRMRVTWHRSIER
jgi:hypothetical protein